MYQITVVFGPTAIQWSLMFRDELNARGVWHKLTLDDSPHVDITDDFGQVLNIPRLQVCGKMFEELGKSQLAWVERGLHSARTQAKAQRMASADPMLSNAVRGPAITSPFETQRFNGR